MGLPKTLEHLLFNDINFNNMAFLSDSTQLKSLKLIDIQYTSNDMLAYVAKNFLELQSFKISCEFCLLNLYLYHYCHSNFEVMFAKSNFIYTIGSFFYDGQFSVKSRLKLRLNACIWNVTKEAQLVLIDFNMVYVVLI